MPYIIIAAVILLPAIWWIATSNKFRKLIVKVDEANAGIDVALTKRYDTLAKLLDITKAYSKHEVDTLENIIKLRKDMTVNEKNDMNTQLDNIQNKISVIAENYPELRSSDNFKQLQVSAADVEEHLQAARRLYNSNVSTFNQLVVTFPNSIVAKSMRLVKQDFFTAEEVKRSDLEMVL